MANPKILQLRIRLLDVEPDIWRRIEIAEDASLADLHDVIQTSMGWMDSHLHLFRVGRKVYGPLVDDDGFGDPNEDEEELELSEAFVRKGSKILYVYDFGDDWQHEIVLEGRSEPAEDTDYPRCTDGERACPLEDCGGTHGYATLLGILADPKHPEYEEWSEWVGDPDFDPEYFDLQVANSRLTHRDEYEADAGDYDVLGDSIIEIVEAQVEDGTPPEARKALERLAAEGIEEVSAWDLLAAAFAFELYSSFMEHRDFDETRYCQNLSALPNKPSA